MRVAGSSCTAKSTCHTALGRNALAGETDRALSALAAFDVRPTRWRPPWSAVRRGAPSWSTLARWTWGAGRPTPMTRGDRGCEMVESLDDQLGLGAECSCVTVPMRSA